MTENTRTITVYFSVCPICHKLEYSFDRHEVSFHMYLHMTTHKNLKEIQIPPIDQITFIINPYQ